MIEYLKNKKDRPKIICLTPIKNEEWILDRFIKCSSLWADTIIISDQGSDDLSKEIALKYDNVIVIDNPLDEYDEWLNRKVLFEEARKIEGEKLFITIDADEAFNSNFFNPDFLDELLSFPAATVFKSNFINITPDMDNYWTGPISIPWGFMDDGSEYVADKIHTNRIIYPEKAKKVFFDDIKIMHFQYTDWERMESKHRWYQCWERINNPSKSSIDIYRAYHHMYSVKKEDIKKLPEEWFSIYLENGIDVKKVNKFKTYYWDKIVLGYIEKYGADFFSREAIWDIDWVKVAKEYGFKNTEIFKDPRSMFQKLIHKWLKRTQSNPSRIDIRIITKILKIFLKK